MCVTEIGKTTGRFFNLLSSLFTIPTSIRNLKEKTQTSLTWPITVGYWWLTNILTGVCRLETKSETHPAHTLTLIITGSGLELHVDVPLSSGQSTSQVWLVLVLEGPALSAFGVQWFPPESASGWRGPTAEGSRWFFLLSSFLWLWLFSLYGDFLCEEVELSGCRRCWDAAAGGSGVCLLVELFSSWISGISLSEPSTEMGPSLSEKGSASDSSSDRGESGASGAFEDS